MNIENPGNRMAHRLPLHRIIKVMGADLLYFDPVRTFHDLPDLKDEDVKLIRELKVNRTLCVVMESVQFFEFFHITHMEGRPANWIAINTPSLINIPYQIAHPLPAVPEVPQIPSDFNFIPPQDQWANPPGPPNEQIWNPNNARPQRWTYTGTPTEGRNQLTFTNGNHLIMSGAQAPTNTLRHPTQIFAHDQGNKNG